MPFVSIRQTNREISTRVRDSIMAEYVKENRKKNAPTIPQIARKMLLAGHPYSEVLDEVQRLNASSTNPFPCAELEKMAAKLGKL